jgi:hypothetical protein
VLLSEVRKAPVVGWFVAMSGEQKGEDFRVRDGQNMLGSSPDCDIVIRDVTVSGHHASIRHKDLKFILTDLDSTNGTFLNQGAESVAREDLKDNDTVRVGDVVSCGGFGNSSACRAGMIVRPGIELANLTDPGCVRERNEDYYCYFEPDDDEAFRARGRLLVVADGMGGHEGGEIASGIAVETVRQTWSQAAPAIPPTC